MWPLSCADDVIGAIGEAGLVVLGLDLRSDGSGATPPGFASEILWSLLHLGGSDSTAVAAVARDAALEALRRPQMREMSGYDWVLITWEDA
jgi:hypothetical protein